MVVEHLGREQRFVAAICAAVALAWDIVLRQHRNDTVFCQRVEEIEARQARMGMRSTYRPGVKQIRITAGQIVDVQRLARHVASGTFMRQRRARYLHSAYSQWHFSTRLFDTSSLYSFEPR